MAYLMVAEAQYKDRSYANSYNVGLNESDCWTTVSPIEGLLSN